MDAPGRRGADRNVAMTVPTPTDFPSRHHGISCAITSRIRDHLQCLLERRHAVPCYQGVNERQGRDDSALHRRIPGFALVRVDPHDLVGEPVQAPHLLTEVHAVAAFPAVAEDDDHGSTGDAALAPAVKERLESLAEPGPP